MKEMDILGLFSAFIKACIKCFLRGYQDCGVSRYITYIGHAVEGGALDYAGRIYMVDGQEYFVRLFDYVDPSSGRATVVVRPDGYKKILRRCGNDNNISRMKLVDELDAALKKALRDYIAAVYKSEMQDRVTLKLG